MKKHCPVWGIFCLFVFSCASTGSFVKIDHAVDQGHYSGSVGLLEKEKKSLYSQNDAVLYYLDKGMLSHYAGQYEDSSQLFESGERAIKAAFTKSITMEIGSYLLNDTTREYAGEDYEDIYINSFNALNYYHRGDLEGAMVEIRRMNEKTAALASKYGVFVTGLQNKALEENLNNIPANPNAPAQFADSALSRYLGMLFHRGAGMEDDARIDGEGLRVAFANAPNVYTYSAPASLSGELNIPKGMARLNVIAFSGLSPVKKEQVIRIPLPNTRWAKIALPELSYRRSEVDRIELVFDNVEKHTLELLEDIEAVARETFKTRQNIIYLKSVIRAMLKGASSSILDAAADETEGSASLILGILSITTQAFAEISEQADLRISRYFPARAHVGGINLEPGIYSFRVNYYSRSGTLIDSVRYEDMSIQKDTLNLAEAVCLR